MRSATVAHVPQQADMPTPASYHPLTLISGTTTRATIQVPIPSLTFKPTNPHQLFPHKSTANTAPSTHHIARAIQYSPNFSLFLHRVFSLLSVALQAHCEPTLEGGVVAPQNQFNVKSSWEKRTELKSLHTDVISS